MFSEESNAAAQSVLQTSSVEELNSILSVDSPRPDNKLNTNKITFRIKVKKSQHIEHTFVNFTERISVKSTANDNGSKSLDVILRTTSRRNITDNPNKKTQKIKKVGVTREDKAKMWDIFDSDKTLETGDNPQSSEMKCLYKSENESGTCDYCNSVLIITDDGFPTCTNMTCGVIYKNTLDYSPEWRFYGAEDKNKSDPTRCGNPINPLLVESSFGCKVICSNSSSYEMRKIRKWTEWQSMPHKEKSLYDEFQFITIMAQNAGIPKIFIDDAIVIHKDISEQKMFRGMNRDGIKSASIYISCRLNGCPRTAHEIAEIFRLDKASATAGCSMAVKILHNIERNFEPSQQTELCSTRPSAFIERYCSKLNINGELIMLSKFIAKKVEENSIINNNTPHAIAAGIVFFISQNCNLNISKLDIKSICGVSEVTINKCYKKLELIRENLIPLCILDKYV